MTFDDFYDYLLNLCDKLSHETDEQAETIDEQAHEINALYKEIEQQKTEINRLTMICDVKDDVAMDIRDDFLRLEKENDSLKAENKTLRTENVKQTFVIGDLQKEIERLHKVFEIKDNARIELVKENTNLKKEINELYTLKNQLADDNNNLRSTIKSYEQLFY